MNEAAVITLPGVGARSDRKTSFVDHVAQCFDRYVKDFGAEPDAIVMVLGGIKQDARVTWTVTGDSEGGSTSMLALSHVAILNELLP